MVLLATVLSFSTWRTLAKAIAMWRNETRQSLLTEARYEAVSEADEDVGEDDDRTLTAGSSRLVSVVGSAKGSPRPAEVVDAEVVPGSTDQEIPDIGPMANSSSMPMRTIPFNLSSLETELEFSGAAISESNVFYFVAIAVTFVSLTVASLTKAFLSETSTHTHALNLIPLFISLFVAGLVSWFVLARDRVRGRPVWSLHGRWWITLLATFISGIGASALGVGGGIFFSPLLLEISPNPDPVRVSALSSTLVLFTAASSALQYAVLGKLHMATVLWYSFFMVGSGAFALWATRRIIAVFGRKSIIVICLGIGLGVSAIMALEQFIQGLFF